MNEVAVIDAYDEGNIRNYKTLMASFKSLRTFEDVKEWDRQAGAEVEKITLAIQELDVRTADVVQRLKQAQEEYAQKNFFVRLFSNRSAEESISKTHKEYIQFKKVLEGFVSELQEAIDFTPGSAEEKVSLLKELKARKKELQVEKREAAAAMKAIRRDARAESARMGVEQSAGLAAINRRSLRYQKEAALRPHEDEKTAIERQLVQVDKYILLAERISE